MPQPYDYSGLVGGFQSPEQAFVGAIKTVETLREQDRQKQLQADFKKDLSATIRKPSAQAWSDLYAKYPTEYAQLNEIRKNTSPAKSNLFTSTAVKLLQLDQAGDQAGVDKLLADTSAAIDAGIAAGSIDADTAQQFADMSNTYRAIKDPEARRGTVSGLLAVYSDKDQFDRISKALGLDLPQPIAEYQARVRKDGKEAADQWWEIQSSKVVTTDDQVVDVGEFLRGKRSVTGKPAPKGVTFTPVENGGQTSAPAPSGNFPRK